MLKNYLKIALRNLRRHKGYSFINITGLAVGLACVLLIVLYVQNELSYDTYHEQGDHIYRIVNYSGFAEKAWTPSTTGHLAPELRTAYPEVIDAVRMKRCGSDLIKVSNLVIRDVSLLCAESNIFNIFSFELVAGDPTTALSRPNTVVLTRSLADKLFRETDPLGQTLTLDFSGEDRHFEITGLVEDVPVNSHFSFDLLIAFESLLNTKLSIGADQFGTYVLLPEEADTQTLAQQILAYNKEDLGKEYVDEVRLQPLKEIYFSEIWAEKNGDLQYVYILSTIALIILLIACANYMNLATARSARRRREVGVRKVVGAHRLQLVRQFLTEALLFSLLAVPLAVAVLEAVLPFFNILADTRLVLDWSSNLPFLLILVSIVGLVGLLAGSYPALFLSTFQPVAVLRGRLHRARTGATLRKALIVFQFAASVVLIACTVIILRQLDYVQQKKLGFETEQIVLIEMTDRTLVGEASTIKQEFLRHPSVLQATAGIAPPGLRLFSGMRFATHPDGKEAPAVTLIISEIDVAFVETMGLDLIAGRNISEGLAERGAQEALVNETAVQQMGWASPEAALGKKAGLGTVVGVVKDFHFASLHQKIEPLMMLQPTSDRARTIMLRIDGRDVFGTLAALEKTWKQFSTDLPFEFSFLQDELNQLYQQEQRAAQVFGIFAGLAIVIACLGLFGLAAFTAEQRTKELGIRKALGATASHLVLLLSKGFVSLVLIAFVIAIPIAYLAMNRWLADFAYRIEISWRIFLIAGLVALLVAIFSVSYQAIRAALANPVESLRYE